MVVVCGQLDLYIGAASRPKDPFLGGVSMQAFIHAWMHAVNSNSHGVGKGGVDICIAASSATYPTSLSDTVTVILDDAQYLWMMSILYQLQGLNLTCGSHWFFGPGPNIGTTCTFTLEGTQLQAAKEQQPWTS
jgi:hypothetical protein